MFTQTFTAENLKLPRRCTSSSSESGERNGAK
ncbi:Protein of unknown function [Pyronema omphalodes CBS 100304]|uniref:Uncharacterized protein n=1 Tax=Pyronema omphalodes (strain CBS 100304) TaxID=1076935 RepID=U4KXZ8_PYROM|nr:Protein of unknown function [Pyronema omphalodes CBS 100304]